ncbi:hypothetical protein [Streptomyces sp. NPDC006285]|uniref:hypothetical protein n=1 Tax=Streptomyces sp. NPDC006285 TaxID=3364742 RepID=UPI0036918F7A
MFPKVGYRLVWDKLAAGLAEVPVASPTPKALRDLRRRLGSAPATPPNRPKHTYTRTQLGTPPSPPPSTASPTHKHECGKRSPNTTPPTTGHTRHAPRRHRLGQTAPIAPTSGNHKNRDASNRRRKDVQAVRSVELFADLGVHWGMCVAVVSAQVGEQA